MAVINKTNSINGQYILATFIAVVVTWILHELAHWATGTCLGYEMDMTLNASFPADGKYGSDGDYQLISAAGPLFTLLQAILLFLLLQKKKIIALYPYLFTCFYMRLLAAGISVLNPNDEARVSQSMGLGRYTLPIIVVIILFLLLYKISCKYHLSRKFNAITLGLVMLFSSALILTDQFLHIRLL
jgi:hypothetical protein